jgi:uncharacterized protein YoxC
MVRQKTLAAGLIGTGIIAFLVVSGSLTAALAQTKFTACVSKKGKIKKLQEGNEPLKNCNGKQVEIMFPSTEKTDSLMEDVGALEVKTVDLMAKDDALMEDIGALEVKTGQLMDKDMELMEDIDGLNDDVSSLNADVAEINAEIDGPIAAALASLQSQIDDIVTSSLIGGDMDYFQQLGPGDETAYMAMYGSNVAGSEDSVTQNMAAAGILTNLFVRSSVPGENNALTVTLRTGNIDTLLSCTISGADDECSVTDVCVQINQGDLISLQVNYDEQGDPTPIFDLRWNSRFVENGTCPDA